MNWDYPFAYDPAVGRFITRDPVGGIPTEPATLNPYAYALNNPVNYTDPSGEFLDTIIDVGFILYDVYRIGADNIFGNQDNFGDNMVALGADITGAALPFCTGLGLAVRGVSKGDDLLDAAGTFQKIKASKGNTGIGRATASEADDLGDAWVGAGATWSRNGKTRISADGERRYRPPSYKPKLGKEQANFEYYAPGASRPTTNAHLDIMRGRHGHAR